MWWAKKTTWANNDYTLRSGDGNKADDATVYIPGEWTSLYLRSNVQGKQIAGLVLYAEKYKIGTKVGEWSFPANSGFHQPGDCVVHQNADFKKYLNVFKVRIPAGAGPVVIKALVKYGLANPMKDGAFYWPNDKHLQLSEGVPRAPVWVEGSSTQSCTDVCTSVGATCDLQTMLADGQSASLFAKVKGTSRCFQPMLAGCSASSPAVSPGGCFYHDSKCELPSVPKPKERYCKANCGTWPQSAGYCCNFVNHHAVKGCRCLENANGNNGKVYSEYNGVWSKGWDNDYVPPTPPPLPQKQALTCDAVIGWNKGARRLCACKGAGLPVPCSGNPCNGHGKCSGNNVCTCDEGWSGTRCSISTAATTASAVTRPTFRPTNKPAPVNACCPNPCGAHGQCSGNGVCTCLNGWSGPKCTVNPCKADSCSGHGSCSGNQVCTCIEGWGGNKCDVNPNMQPPNVVTTTTVAPTNTGTCTNACGGKVNPNVKPNCCPVGYRCYEKDEWWFSCRKECTKGLHEDERNTDYHTPWSCVVRGGAARRRSLNTAATATCENGKITGAVCSCDAGYQGGGLWVSGATYPACVAVNYCDPNPCLNGGKCTSLAVRKDRGIDEGVGYVCDCTAGFSGYNCHQCSAGSGDNKIDVDRPIATIILPTGGAARTTIRTAVSGSSSGPQPLTPAHVLAAVLAYTVVPSGDAVTKLGAMALGLLWSLPQTQAHNWMVSPARGNEAGENNGFNGFTSPPGPQRTSRIHTQVGPGQKFPIEWAAGHGFGSHTYFAVLRAADEPKLAQHTIKLLDDYMQNAPATARDYMKEHPVMHVSAQEHNHELLTGGNVAKDYVWVPSMPATKGVRPSVFRQNHFGANPSVERKKWSQGQDMRVKYKSAKYPWIISAHKFLMKYDYPEDSDTTMIEIPAELGPGKYIVAYQWSGYYDVVDVNVLNVASTDIFGKGSNSPSGFDRNDHCQFIPGYTGYKTHGCKALGANDRVSACASLCTGTCNGIQVVQTNLDTNVVSFAKAQIPAACPAGSHTHVCFGVTQGTPKVGPAYRISADPEDPVFYNSCFRKSSGWSFAQICETCPALTVDPGWVFGDKCISCTAMRQNTEAGGYIPKWKLLGQNEQCRACDNQGR